MQDSPHINPQQLEEAPTISQLTLYFKQKTIFPGRCCCFEAPHRIQWEGFSNVAATTALKSETNCFNIKASIIWLSASNSRFKFILSCIIHWCLFSQLAWDIASYAPVFSTGDPPSVLLKFKFITRILKVHVHVQVQKNTTMFPQFQKCSETFGKHFYVCESGWQGNQKCICDEEVHT